VTHRIVLYDRERHGDGAWQVVRTVFEEYGFPLSEDGYDDDLLDPPSHYPAGGFAVAEDGEGRVIGCVGLTGEGRGVFELHRLYVLPKARRGGLGRALVEWVLAEAAARGAREVVLFSDIAFRDAHRLYERLGFRRHRFRYAPDPWASREWGFVREIGG
jgi:GNAT superfamily N-acetyltransferase